TSAEFYAPLKLEEGAPRQLQTLLTPSGTTAQVAVHASAEGSDTFACHARFGVSREAGDKALPPPAPTAAGAPLPDFYDLMASAGFGL
ncbi:hypothetical protein C1X89_35370, partial [Pseudomonas sp. GP01-A8]|uniref:hypothetical protein n=1 Tax=Pseudomonas sp. GP01-A8 TaxID=2070565 RepID=UPI000CC741BC